MTNNGVVFFFCEAGSFFNISTISASFMINLDGKIVGKNIRGLALKQVLEKNL